MNDPSDHEFRGARLDEIAADTSYTSAGWRWFAEHWHWTERESEVAALLEIGLESKQIAARLGISDDTVNTHVKALFEKTGEHGRGAFLHKLSRRCPQHLRGKPEEERTPPELNTCPSPELGMVFAIFSVSIRAASHGWLAAAN